MKLTFVWPEIHRIGTVQFTLYEVMRGAAIVLSLCLCIFLNVRQGIPARKTLLIAAGCVPISVGAARLVNALEYGAAFRVEALGA